MDKKLRDLGKQGGNNYPPELKTATKAEYTTLIRQYNKDNNDDDGCPFTVLKLALPAALAIKVILEMVKA